MIVIDIGNTNIVLGIYYKNKLNKVFRISTEKNIKIVKNKYITFFSSIKKDMIVADLKVCIVSSVVPSLNHHIKNYFKKIKFEFFLLNPKKIPFDLVVNYKLDQIGSDRIANFISIYNKRIKNSIIIDFGTATTFDVIKNNEYYGGLIFPGIDLSLNSLIKNADLLESVNIAKRGKIIAQNTSSSIQSGFYFGYLYAINGILKKIIYESKFKPKIYITGGLGKIFKDKINYNPIYNENLTLEGLREIGNKIYGK
tara:strand:- start:5770 stop:6531 length:762 start_codon:yes stop_codon:yes gene_type:complete